MTTGLLARLSADIVYIRLHGLPRQSYLYGDPGWGTALSFEQVRTAPKALFLDSKVFLEGCFGSRISGAFLEAGAAFVVGCRIATWGRRGLRLGPSSQVGRVFVNQIKKGAPPEDALGLALEKVPPLFREGWAIYK